MNNAQRALRLSLFAAFAAIVSPWTDARAAESPALQELTFHFRSLDRAAANSLSSDAFIDVGAIAAEHGGGRRRHAVVRERITLRLESGNLAASKARVSVALGSATPGCTVRVDGVTLSTMPRVIDPVHRVGAAVVHEIEMTIPADVPAGPFLNDLQWFAETD
jgi:hypothetical protein